MAHEHQRLCLVLDSLDRIDHADVFAHLEGGFGVMELEVLQAVLAQNLKQLNLKLGANLGNINAICILVQGQTLQEVPEMAFVTVLVPSPRVEGRVGLKVLSTDSIT